MKKIVAVLTVLAFTMPVGLCGCNGGDPADTSPSPNDNTEGSDTQVTTSEKETATEATTESASESTSEVTEDTDVTSSDMTDDTSETILTLESVYVSDLWEDYSYMDNGYDSVYHVPSLNIESEDAGQINSEIMAVMEEGPVLEYEETGHAHKCASQYVVYITDSNLMTVVFSLEGEWGDDDYYMWTINLDTGERLTNRQIADAAGITDIRAAAMFALDRYFESMNLFSTGGTVTPPDFIDGEPNPEGPNYGLLTENPAMMDAALNTYSESTLNDDMTVGLDADSRLIFSSEIVSLYGGAISYNRCYTCEGELLLYGEE